MCGIWAIFGSVDLPLDLRACLRIAHRGPDAFRMEQAHRLPGCCLGFHRLAIMDQDYGMQPLKIHALPHVWLIYNGEIYNYKTIEEEFSFNYETACDGEAMLHLYARGGAELMAKNLDGVFSFVLLDTEHKKVFVGRDTFGVRPSFKVRTDDGMLAVCSEAKGLIDVLPTGGKYKIEPVKPGTYEEYDLSGAGFATYKQTVEFNKVGQAPAYKALVTPQGDDIYENVRNLFMAATRKRMMAHRRIGCMLSGGLDSSIVTALVCRFAKEMALDYTVQTFSVGMKGSPDLAAAKKVADYLGTEHHEVIFTVEEGMEAIQEVIKSLETYDITTIRASIGMYIISRYIAEQTDARVIFSGEGADEVAQGYIYFHKQPSLEEGDEESRRLLNDLYYYDVLRADRTTAAHGLELRVPFLDHVFTSYILSLPAAERRPQKDIEKYLLRKAFDKMHLIPDSVLWRPKEAFSDGLSSKKKSWFEMLQEHAEKKVSTNELEEAPTTFPHLPPTSQESYLYRRTFEKQLPGCSHLVPYYWMPRWTGATDPSARTLAWHKADD